MAKISKAYWKDQALAREASYQAGSVRTMAELNRAYDQAGENILRRLDSIEQNAAKRSAAEQNPYIYRRQLAEATKAAIEREFEQLHETEVELTAARYAEVMNDAYYKSLFDMQRGTGLGFSFAKLPKRAVETTLNEGWLGRDFSKSVWRNTGVLAQRVQEVVQGGLLSGAGIDTMVAQLATAKLEINDTLREGKFAAYRLIRTETNYFANQGELMSYAEAGIAYYDYLATLDGRTSKICQKLDGVVFRVADAEVGRNYPPMHPYCRSTTVAHFDDKNLDELQRRARDPVTGKTQLVPASMNYQEWYDTYVKGNKEAEASLKAAKNASGDKGQFEKYADILGENAPKTFADFQKMKYTDSERFAQLKAEARDKSMPTLKEALKISDDLWIPANTAIESVHIIAGKGADAKIRVAEKLSSVYGGLPEEWSKCVGKITSDKFVFDIHWYEHEAFGRFDFKIKSLKRKEGESMKVRYVGDNIGVDGLTDGKTYECLGVEGDFLRVIDDSGEDFLYSAITPKSLSDDSKRGAWEIVQDDDRGSLKKTVLALSK